MRQSNALRFSLLSLAITCSLVITVHSRSPSSSCPPHQRHALSRFNHSFFITPIDVFDFCGYTSYPKTSSWREDEDCCSWEGVACDNSTGDIIGLDLSCATLRGAIHSNSSLFSLRHLRSLSLAGNDLMGSSILVETSVFSQMKHLNLSWSSLSGIIPTEISRLSKLVSLDLSGNELEMQNPTMKMLVTNLTQLEDLHLSYVNMSAVIPTSMMNFTSSLISLDLSYCSLGGKFPDIIFQLPNLQQLDLGKNPYLYGTLPESNWSSSLAFLSLWSCSFAGGVPSSIGGLPRLTYLDLSNNNFTGGVPSSIGGLTRLTDLYLSCNYFIGGVPNSIGSLDRLMTLDLSSNHFTGGVPNSIGSLDCLTFLALSNNNFIGGVPSSIGGLQGLTDLDLSTKNFTGGVSSSNGSLSRLIYLDLSKNNFIGGVSSSIGGLFRLTYLDLSSNNFTGRVPTSIGGLQGLTYLDLSTNNFTGGVPSSICGLPRLAYLNLARNNFTGEVPSSIGGLPRLTRPLLSSNNFTNFVGQWPGDIFLRSTSLWFIDLSTNRFEGPLPLPSYTTSHYSVSNNNFSGEISSLLCNATNLEVIDLSNNGLTGTLPECLKHITIQLIFLNLRANGLQGSIPEIFDEHCALTSLDFSRNQFEGPLPASLSNCSQLEALDVGSNKIVDSFPNWLADLPLKVLNLRSNKLQGRVSFPKGTHPFSSVRILDISNNGLNGSLPDNLITEMFGLMRMDDATDGYMGDYYGRYSVMINLKGVEMEIDKINVQFGTLDLSRNHFWGEIPRNIGLLKALKGLNFSHNSFTGTIPQSIGNLTNLESLDLSSNNLDGEIPREVVQLTSLGAVNLSRNNLTGPIPPGGHFNTFSNSSFEGNPGLCGIPLTRSCGQGRAEAQPQLERRDDGKDERGGWMDWKFVAMGFGSGVGIGISLGYMAMEMGRPLWLARMVIQLEGRCRKRSKKRNGLR